MEKQHIPQQLTIEWLTEAYANQEVTPEDIIKEIIKRSEQDKAMNIWITPPRMERIRPYLDKLASVNQGSLPLWGVPFAIKDNIDWAGVPTTVACPDYEYMAAENATVVELLVQAGAIPIGKTNMDQFATGLVGIRSPYGETHNARNMKLISGGSSSGSAVAVARGQAAFALGTDTAGSGRVPAALNGIYGFKPSVGAWSTKGVVPASASLDCVSVFTNVLQDAYRVDRVVRGQDDKDPWSRDIPVSSNKQPTLYLLPKGPLQFFGPYAWEYKDAWHKAVTRLKNSGVPWKEVDIEMFSQAAALLYDGPYVDERWAGLGHFVESHPGSVLPVTEQILRSGETKNYSASSLFKSLHTLQRFRLETSKLLRNAVLLMPTAGGTWTREEVRDNPIQTNSMMGLYTNHCNLLDLCALSLPTAPIAEDMPFGITFFALSGDEGMLRAAAQQFLQKGEGAVILEDSFEASPEESTLVAVCGLHMRGYPLEKQMLEMGATFVKETKTAAKYELYKLFATPSRPGLIRKNQGGASIHVEVWRMPLQSFGKFVHSIAPPLGIGKIELQDGSEIPGFVCEAYAEAFGENITSLGSWHAVSDNELVK